MKQHRKRQNKKSRNRHTLQYGAGILAFLLLIAAALWLPQIFFEISDAFMYGEVNLTQQEKPDVLTLTTGYEESLYRRLAGFAEGLAAQRQYYVDRQPKEVTEEIQSFLFDSELRFYAEGISRDVIIEIFSDMLGIYSAETFLQKTGLELNQWNQYVIYSDDYAKGVNFILWCFGLTNSGGDSVTILMDAHDHTVYALQITGGTESFEMSADELEANIARLYGNVGEGTRTSVYRGAIYTQHQRWMTLWMYYDISSSETLNDYMLALAEYLDGAAVSTNSRKRQSISAGGDISLSPARMEVRLQDSAGNEMHIYEDSGSFTPYGEDGTDWYGSETDGALYYILPFGENRITFDIYNLMKVYDAQTVVNTTMGIRDIYELIPEFQQAAQGDF